MFSVRRVEPSDTDAIEKLIQSRGGVTHFGDETKSVSRRVEESTLSVVTVLDDSTTVAFATFSQKCNRESSELWLSGVGKGGPSCSDSLWTTFFVADELYQTEADFVRVRPHHVAQQKSKQKSESCTLFALPQPEDSISHESIPSPYLSI